MNIADIFSLRAYGVIGYSLATSLALASASVALAYYRAGRDKGKSLSLALSALLFAVLFSYLVLVSMQTGWFDPRIMQPIMRTVAIAASLFGWSFLWFALRKEAKVNGSPRETSETQTDDFT